MRFLIDNIWLVAAAVGSATMLVWSFLGNRMRGIGEVNTFEAVQLINHRNALVVDVREDGEYRAGHIPNSRHLALKELRARIGELEKFRDKPIVVICRSGQRASGACGLLKESGFGDVRVLKGGISAWQEANLPVSTKK